jgi:SAM-dependent methyltransferase
MVMSYHSGGSASYGGVPGHCDHPEPFQQVLFPARDYISGDTFSLVRCGRCMLVRTTPLPLADEKIRFYPPEYYGDARRYVFPVDYLLNRLQARRSRLIHAANGNRPGTVLDIGCGRGLLLSQLRKLGWSVTGTELSDGAARYAREVLHLDVSVGDLESHRFPDMSFDSVVLWHVLEHVENPASLLHEVTRLVRPGGCVLLAVPNFGSVEAQLCKAAWFHLDVPRHLFHFTPETLLRMLTIEGLASERIRYFSPEYDYFSVIQSVLNRSGIRQNSLYELLRAGPAKLLQRRGTVAKRTVLANLSFAPLLGLLSIITVPLAASLHRGATVIVLVRKM